MELGIGSVQEGKVTGITKFGAFVVLPEGKTGLVHISEIAHTYVNDIREHLSEGQEVKVKVINIDETGRINLSIKKTTEAERPPQPAPAVTKPAPPPADDFEDRLSKFMQDSKSNIASSKLYGERNTRRRSR